MSNKKSKKNNIKVLQNITFKVASDGNSKTLFSPEERNLYYGESLICKRACLDENSFKTDCTAVDYVHNSRVRRYTASVLVFDEEPVFSDSDEEKEYNKRILETHKIETTSNQTSKKSSVEVQCDIPLDDKKYLLPDELKYDREISEVQKFGIISSQAPNKVNVAVQCNILLDELKVKEFVKLFANSDFENVPEDFKQLVVLCRQLLYKWNPSPSPSKRNVSCNSNDNVTNTQLFQQQPETIRNVEDPKLHSTSNEFLPSKSNNGVNDFTSESFNTDENIFSSSQIVDTPDQNGSFTENNWVRRSTRQRRSKNNSKIIVDTPKTNKRNLRSNKPNVESKDTAENIFTPDEGSDTVGNSSKKRTHERATVSNSGSNKKSKKKSNGRRGRRFRVKMPLSKKQSRALARNWMKANKRCKTYELFVPVTKHGLKSLQHTHKLRRLYSPDEWLQSKEFLDLFQ